MREGGNEVSQSVARSVAFVLFGANRSNGSLLQTRIDGRARLDDVAPGELCIRLHRISLSSSVSWRAQVDGGERTIATIASTGDDIHTRACTRTSNNNSSRVNIVSS